MQPLRTKRVLCGRSGVRHQSQPLWTALRGKSASKTQSRTGKHRETSLSSWTMLRRKSWTPQSQRRSQRRSTLLMTKKAKWQVFSPFQLGQDELVYKEMNNWTIKNFNRKYENLMLGFEGMNNDELEHQLQKVESRTRMTSDKASTLEKIQDLFAKKQEQVKQFLGRVNGRKELRTQSDSQEKTQKDSMEINDSYNKQQEAIDKEKHEASFIEKFGMPIQDKIDMWIMMSNSELEQELIKYQVPYEKNDILLTQLMQTTIFKARQIEAEPKETKSPQIFQTERDIFELDDDLTAALQQAENFKQQLQKFSRQQTGPIQLFESDPVFKEEKKGLIRSLPRNTQKMQKLRPSTKYYSSFPTLGFSLNTYTSTMGETQKINRPMLNTDLFAELKQIGFSDYLSTLENVPQKSFDLLQPLLKYNNFLQGSNPKHILKQTAIQALNELAFQVNPNKPTFKATAEALALARQHIEVVKNDPEITQVFEKLLMWLQFSKKDKDLFFNQITAEQVAKDTSFLAFLDNFANVSLKPENQEEFVQSKGVLFAGNMIKVPSESQQTLGHLNSLGSILGRLVNLHPDRTQNGQLTHIGDRNIDKIQEVVLDVQNQFKKNGMMKFGPELSQVPITQRANMLLLFPPLQDCDQTMKDNLKDLIRSLLNGVYRIGRSRGTQELSCSQILYMHARAQEFYYVDNNLVSEVRTGMLDFPGYWNWSREQIFQFIKVLVSDSSLSSKGHLNDVQFFAGCESGCKYDPFLPKNRKKLFEIEETVNKKSSELNLLQHICANFPLTLSIAHTIEEHDAQLYMFDYILAIMPCMIEYQNSHMIAVRLDQTGIRLKNDFEFPINIILRHVANRGQFQRYNNEFTEALSRISFLSKNQHLKRDADRELLQRYVDALTLRYETLEPVMFHNNQTDNKYFEIQHKSNYVPVHHQVSFNRIVKDLVNPEFEVEPQVLAKDVEIINSILRYQPVVQQLFTSFKEATDVFNAVLDHQFQSLQNSPKPSLTKFFDQEKLLKSITRRSQMLTNLKFFTKDQPELEQKRLKLLNATVDLFSKGLSEFSASSTQHNFPIKAFLEANAEMLKALEPHFMAEPKGNHAIAYLEKVPAIQIINSLLHNANKPHSYVVDAKLSNDCKLLVNKSIKSMQWNEVQSLVKPLIAHFGSVLKIKNQTTANARMQMFVGQEEICTDYILRLKNVRTLHQEHLANLVSLIDYLPSRNEEGFDNLLMNITPVLNTIHPQLFLVDQSELQAHLKRIADPNTVEIKRNTFTSQYIPEKSNEQTEEEREPELVVIPEYEKINDEQIIASHQQLQLGLLRLYANMQKRNKFPAITKRAQLASIAHLFTCQFDNLSFDDHISFLNLLGNNFDNYDSYTLKKLSEKYSNYETLVKIQKENNNAFFRLAYAWPQFIKNLPLLQVIAEINLLELKVEEQFEALKVLTDKQILHPELINGFFRKVMPLTDRELVKKYLDQLITSMAILGYASGINMHQLTQVFRRLYKEPANVEINLLLDFFVVQALNNTDFAEFERKSKQFVEACLDRIEEVYTGSKTTTSVRFKPESEKALAVSNGEQTIKPLDGDPDTEVFDIHYFNTLAMGNHLFKKRLDLVMQNNEEKWAENPVMQKYAPYISHKHQRPYDVEEKDQETPEEIEQSKVVDEEAEASELKVYDRKASDTGKGDEYAFMEKNKMSKLGRKFLHQLLYININRFDCINLYEEEIAKAWITLFHFRGKSIESLLYEQFNIMAMRNSHSKAKLNRSFGKLYFHLLDHFSNLGVRVSISKTCSQTGWPIDMQLDFNPADKLLRKDQKDEKIHAIYFLTKEEACFNTKNNFKMEPLGVQKLMLMHLRDFGVNKVSCVTEEEINKDFDGTIDFIKKSVRINDSKQSVDFYGKADRVDSEILL